MFNIASNYYFAFEDIQTFILLMLIEEYVNGAELQISRVERTKKLFKKGFSNFNENPVINWDVSRKRHLRLFCDIHFYFICLAQVNKCFKRLRKKLDNRNLDKVYSKFQKKFKQDIRDDLEHIDERAVDLKKGKPIEPIKDFRNYFNDNFTFNHKSYSVNKDSLKELKKTYKDIISVIHNDCAMKKPQFINDMMRKKGTEKIVEIIQKKFKLIQ